MTATDWDLWLDDLEDAAAALEEQLASGEPLAFPDLAPPPIDPDHPGLPGEYLPRTMELLNRLERLERIAETQRDALHTQLRTLAPRRPRRAFVPGYELGAALDVAG